MSCPNFAPTDFTVNGDRVTLNAVPKGNSSYMLDFNCEGYKSLKTSVVEAVKNDQEIKINRDGKSFSLSRNFLNDKENVPDLKQIDYFAHFDKIGGFQVPVKLTIQGKEPSSGGLIINQNIFTGKTFPVNGFVCLINFRPWRIVSNHKGIWANPVPSGEVFRALRAPRSLDDEKA